MNFFDLFNSKCKTYTIFILGKVIASSFNDLWTFRNFLTFKTAKIALFSSYMTWMRIDILFRIFQHSHTWKRLISKSTHLRDKKNISKMNTTSKPTKFPNNSIIYYENESSQAHDITQSINPNQSVRISNRNTKVSLREQTCIHIANKLLFFRPVDKFLGLNKSRSVIFNTALMRGKISTCETGSCYFHLYVPPNKKRIRV